jgi:hypothetical protein
VHDGGSECLAQGIASRTRLGTRHAVRVVYADDPVGALGHGVKDTAPFTASSDSADLAHAFNCASAGSMGHFALLFLDRTGVEVVL